MFASLLFSLCFRECKDMRFCRDNLYSSTPQPWSAGNDQLIDKKLYKLDLLYNNAISNYTLEISKIKNSGFRIRVAMPASQSEYRYDFMHDNLIVDSTKIANLDEIKSDSNATHLMITYEKLSIIIAKENIKITVLREKNAYITLNSDSFMLIEDGSETPIENWDGKNETFPHGKTAVGISFSFDPKSFITGLHESNSPLNLPDGEDRRYARDAYSLYGYVPFFFAHSSSYKYTPSIFWMNPTDLLFSIHTNDKSRDVRFVSEGGFIDFVVSVDDIKDVMSEFLQLTGKPELPPAWTLGYQQSKWGYMSQKEVDQIISNFTAENISWDVMWLDIDHLDRKRPFTFSDTFFYNRQKFFDDMKNNHKTIIRIADPHMPKADDYSLYSECENKGYFVMKGDKPFVASCWPGNSSWPDFLRNEVRNWWSTQYKDWPDNVYPWNDMNEVAAWESMEGTLPKDALQMNGTVETREVHSIYGLSMTAATFQAMNNRATRPFILTRSFYAGTQKYAWTWSGDNNAKWEHLCQSIDSLLTSNLNGQPFTGSDVGGFGSNTTAQLLARWYQAGSLLYPLFREHSANFTEYREPYLYKNNTEIYNAIKQAISERYQGFPLLYSAMERAVRKGIPFAAPLFYHFPEEDLHNVNYQPIVGDVLMVAPVVKENATTVDIVKPPGLWYDFRTGALLVNGTRSANISEGVPAYLRGGKITALLSESVKDTYGALNSKLTVVICLDEDGEAKGKLYFDDGTTKEYKSGGYLRVEIEYDDGEIEIDHEGDETINPKADKIIIYGYRGTKVPSINIPNGQVTLNGNILTISNIDVDLSFEHVFKLAHKLPKSTVYIIVGITVAFGFFIIIISAFCVQKHLRKEKNNQTYESFH